MGFYDDSDKITFDEADRLVSDFKRRYKDRRTYVRAKDVCQELEIEASMHNKIRIHEALEKECEAIKKSNGTKFRMK